MNVRERFERMCIPEPNSGCSIWLGATDASGYGRFSMNGRNWKANRVAWLLAHSDPGEMHVLHRCDNRLCVNVEHLFLGTNADNCIDKCKKGRHPFAKLKAEDVINIRRMKSDGMSSGKIAAALALPRYLVTNVTSGGYYSYV